MHSAALEMRIAFFLWSVCCLSIFCRRSALNWGHKPGSLRRAANAANAIDDRHSHSTPAPLKSEFERCAPAVLSAIALTAASRPTRCLAEADVQRRDDAFLNDDSLQKAEVNLQSDDFWYPPFMIGEWNTSLVFESSKLINSVPVDVLASTGALPGFSKYSVFFLPDMGRDVEGVSMRFVQIDSHPREDHPHNLRSLVQAFCPETVVDEAPYYFQKAPNWLSSPSNRWRVKYHDGVGSGVVDLYTQKRNIRIFAGTVETAEFIRQTHHRLDDTKDARPVVSDYCLNWRLTVPESLKDEFVTVEDLRRTPLVLGSLDVYIYLQPSNKLYAARPGRPAGVFTYNVTMRREFDDSTTTTASSEYPYSDKAAGPVELEKYFGY